MAPEALGSSKKQRLSQFPRVGIGQGKSQPTIGNLSFQGLAIGEGLLAAFCLFPVIFAVHRFHLHFPGTGFTGLHHGFTARCCGRACRWVPPVRCRSCSGTTSRRCLIWSDDPRRAPRSASRKSLQRDCGVSRAWCQGWSGAMVRRNPERADPKISPPSSGCGG